MPHRIPVRALRSWLVPVVGALLLTPAVHAQENDAPDNGSQVYQTVLKSTVLIMSPRGDSTYASGSGFLVDKAKRLVVTNYHVVTTFDEARVAFPVYQGKKLITERSFYMNLMGDRQGIRGKVIAREKRRDLALIQLQLLPKDAVAVTLATDNPRPGEMVHSVGSPGRSGGVWVYTQGKVRQVYQNKWRAVGGAAGDEPLDLEAQVIETDSLTHQGDSGGPLANDKGEIVGVTQGGTLGDKRLSIFIHVSEVVALLKKSKARPAAPPRATASNPKNKPLAADPLATTPKKTAEDPERLEQVAAAKLKLARQLAEDGKVERARERYEEIIKDYPKTRAAKDARRLLDDLK